MFRVNNKDTLTISLSMIWWVFFVNFEHISYICSSVSLVHFEQVNASWVIGSLV